MSIVMALVAALAVFAAIGLGATSRASVAPKNTSPATISGTMQVGSTLTANNGNWSGTDPKTYSYQWRRCDQTGGSCSSISGATSQTYVLKDVDKDNTLRVVVTAKNADGSASSTTVPTAAVTAAATTPAPAPATGCPKTAESAQAVAVADVASPARLQVDGFQPSPRVLTSEMSSFSLRVHISDTCGDPVSGANVYATAVPFNQVSIPALQPTGGDGWVTLTFNRLGGFPASAHQRLVAMFVRASKPGESVLAGISTARLISVHVRLH